MTERIEFLAPLPPRGLRRNREARDLSWRARLKSEYSEAVWCAAQAWSYQKREEGHVFRKSVLGSWDSQPRGLPGPWERAHLALEWRHHRVGPDPDNALASCKVLIDTLTTRGRRPLGLVVDDSPEHLTVEISTKKVRHKSEEGVMVQLNRSGT